MDLPCVHRAGLDAQEGWFLKRVSFRFLPYHRLSDEVSEGGRLMMMEEWLRYPNFSILGVQAPAQNLC